MLRRRGIESVITAVTAPPNFPDPFVAYNFNEGSGATSADATGNNATLTVHGTTPWAANGHTSAALNGDTSYGAPTGTADVNHDIQTEIAVSFWLNVNTTPDNYVGLFAQNGNWDAYLNPSGQIGWDLWGAGESSYAPPLNTWVHICMVSTTGSLYVNGTAQETDLGSGGNLTVSQLQLLGSYDTQPAPVWLDDFRITDSALTTAQITSMMNTPV